MAKYYARMLDGETGGEGQYVFDGPEDLMRRTADEVVSTFFDHVEAEVLHRHADWEVNGVMKNKKHKVVTAIGSLLAEADGDPSPFLLMIAERERHL